MMLSSPEFLLGQLFTGKDTGHNWVKSSWFTELALSKSFDQTLLLLAGEHSRFTWLSLYESASAQAQQRWAIAGILVKYNFPSLPDHHLPKSFSWISPNCSFHSMNLHQPSMNMARGYSAQQESTSETTWNAPRLPCIDYGDRQTQKLDVSCLCAAQSCANIFEVWTSWMQARSSWLTLSPQHQRFHGHVQTLLQDSIPKILKRYMLKALYTHHLQFC